MCEFCLHIETKNLAQKPCINPSRGPKIRRPIEGTATRKQTAHADVSAGQRIRTKSVQNAVVRWRWPNCGRAIEMIYRWPSTP
jgi:predicted RNA-binding Zn-ribbon protein involved in translation (DUF1610 family)